MSSSEKTEIKEKIINTAKKNPKGISHNDIKEALPEVSPAELVTAINELLQQEHFDLFNQGGSLIYRYIIYLFFCILSYLTTSL